MKYRYSVGVAALASAAAMLWTVAASAQIMDYSKYPDWAGQWRRVPDGGPPRYDPGRKNGLAQEAPLKPEYQKLLEASLKDQEAGGQGLDTTYKCIPTGMPRMMSGVFPVEWVFTPQTTFMLSEFMIQSPRRIYTDGRSVPNDEEPTYVCYSIGKGLDTDGDGRFDTLEVETRNIRGPKTWDQTGMPMADDNDAVVKERLYLDKADPKVLHNEITTMDNSVTRPWSVLKSYRRDKEVIWVDNTCTEANPYVTIEGQTYFLSAEGKLMPLRKNQSPPDLKYFNQVKQ
jgi:hypothetical protein